MPASDLAVDRLGEDGGLQVVLLDGARFGGARPRDPHRHDYHELIWVRAGTGRHRIDGAPVPIRAPSVTVIGRGQVHVFEHAEALHGAVVRFGDELLTGGGTAARRAAPGWLLAGRGGRSVAVPADDAPRLDALLEALHAEARRPPDAASAELARHLIGVVLLWIERWYDASRTERRDADDAEVQLHRRFTRVLEDDFARHHDARHYADALAVPQATLARALTHVTGRSTKELVLDRVMVEAARLLRYTGLTVGEIAHRTGFDDPLYFSRAFKRRFAESPMAYRDRLRGGGASAR